MLLFSLFTDLFQGQRKVILESAVVIDFSFFLLYYIAHPWSDQIKVYSQSVELLIYCFLSSNMMIPKGMQIVSQLSVFTCPGSWQQGAATMELGSGTICGVSWALLGASWPFGGRSKSSF